MDLKQTEPIKPEDIKAFIKNIKDSIIAFERALEIGLERPGTFEVGDDRAAIAYGTPKPPTLLEVIKELLAAKASGNRSPHYTNSLKVSLGTFAKGMGNKPIAFISELEIEEYLAQSKNPGTRKIKRALLSVLFAYSVRRRYRPENPCMMIENVSVERNAPFILTPAQVETLLSNCPTPIKPYLVLATFAGLRPMEITSPYRRLDWKAVNLETRSVTVIGKRRRRQVPLEPRAVKMLTEHPNREGPICPIYSNVMAWTRGEARRIMGWKEWPRDALRHTAASNLLALHQDVGKVSTWLGNSPQILQTHYLNLVTEADCKAFWGI